MARLHTYGFEMNTTDFECGTYSSGTISISAVEARTGTYSLLLSNGNERDFNIAGTTEIYIGFGAWFNLVDNSNLILEIRGTGGDMFYIYINPGGSIGLFRSGTLVASSTRNLIPEDWYYFEIKYIPDNAAGECTVLVNGSQWVTFSGDTIASAGSMTIVRMQETGGNLHYHYVDDFVINDDSGADNNTYPGQVHLSLATVTSDGDASDWTPSAGSNYENVDEIPPSTADYNYSSNATDVDLYDITDPLAGTETILNLIVNGIMQLDNGSGDMALTLKTNGTEYDGDTTALTETWTLYQHVWADNPDDSNPWEPADIDDLQIGAEVK